MSNLYTNFSLVYKIMNIIVLIITIEFKFSTQFN